MSFHATVESMSKVMDEMGITELDLERQFLFGLYRKHIHISKQNGAVIATTVDTAKPTNTACTAPITTSGCVLKSPMVGVAYLSPEPGAKPFVNVGDTVHVGDTVALIEAMKTFNPIKADRDGTVKEILVADGTAVEFEQPIVIIE